MQDLTTGCPGRSRRSRYSPHSHFWQQSFWQWYSIAITTDTVVEWIRACILQPAENAGRVPGQNVTGTNRLCGMTLKVFGPQHGQISVYMAWKGRGETPTEIAARLSRTLTVLTDLYPDGRAAFCTLGSGDLSAANRMPDGVEGLADLAVSKSDKNPDGTVREQGRTSLVAVLKPNPETGPRSDAMLSVAAGTPLGLNNKVSLQLEDSFPPGTPSETARWFLDLVRIWQPQYALLKTALTNSTDLGLGTNSGYLSWVSTKAFGYVPEVASAVCFPFGDGVLYAAREWSIAGFAALSRDLAAAGGARILDTPKRQDPPAFPQGYPGGLDRLDDLVTWGPELDASPGRGGLNR